VVLLTTYIKEKEMKEYPIIILGKDTVADQEYLEVMPERLERIKLRQLPERDRLVAEKAKYIAEVDAKIALLPVREVIAK